MITIHMTQEQAKRLLAAVGEVMVGRLQSADQTREDSPVLANHFAEEASTLASIYCAISTSTQKEA
jgi:hypothetical protein